MATDPNFVPVFGPNGAVMNAPSMTPEMRAKLERASQPPSKGEIARELGSLVVFVVAGLTLISQSGSIHDFIRSSQWWSGAVAGAAVVVAVTAVLRAITFNFRRWELDSKTPRSLDMPDWGRWLLAMVDTLAIAAYATAIAWFMADIERAYPAVWSIVGMSAGAIASVGLALRWNASRLGWKWRKAAA
jgi:ABC-type phosphate/phosphonate transport system permease subunit